MAHIIRVVRKRKGGPKHAWKVRYRDPDRVERARTFERKTDAERFAASVETDKSRGEYLDPRAGRVTVAEWASEWAGTKRHNKPKTWDGYESLLRTHILPALGSRSLASVRRVDIERLLSGLRERGLSASRIRQVRYVLGPLFDSAVRNGAIARSPVEGVKPPRAERREMQFLSADQVRMVADTAPKRYRALLYLLAYGGLRWGEAAALRRSRCNLLRSRIEVAESVAEVNGTLHYGPPKAYQVRAVAVPAFLRDMLAEHLGARADDAPDALVFTTETGTPLRTSNFRQRVWWPALDAAGLPRTVRIHDLRHTCASLLIARGAHPKAIQQHLGHSSIQVTFDVYGHLLPDEQDRIAAALDDTFRTTQIEPEGVPQIRS